ncbi:MAG: class I SAM-dependent methyltransferase [Firmicutes bacterium]|nr:class I SAM-dependent methyltransferase [Bacillota bacterium]
MKHNYEPMGAFFNKHAPTYDHDHTAQIVGGVAMKDIVAGYLPEGARDILDLGCGTGLELPAIFARFPEARVVGIDLAEDMLALLHERCAGFAVETLHMSYFDYDFPEKQFDAVISVMSLHHFSPEQKIGLYSRVRSTLKPGGVFLNCDYYIGNPLCARLQFARLRRLKIEPGAMHIDTPLTTRQELQTLRQAGFARVEMPLNQDNTTLIAAYGDIAQPEETA